MTPSTSVVVPTFNREGLLRRLLEALAGQVGEDGDPLTDFEVVVADDGSTDGTADLLRRVGAEVPYRLVAVGGGANHGPAVARNLAWRAASGEVVAFIDDDCLPDPHWLVTLSGRLEDPGVAVVAGRTRPPDDQLGRIGPFSSYLDVRDETGYLTSNIAYRRRALETVGGFDEEAFPLQNGEDTDLGLRVGKAGFAAVFEPGALVWHDVHPSDFWTHLRDVRHLEGMVALVARHPEARRAPLGAGWWLRSVDKAVVLSWLAAGIVARRPHPLLALAAGGGAAAVYTWQFTRSHYRPRSAGEWARAVPLAFVADSWAVVVMVRSSIRHRTLLL